MLDRERILAGVDLAQLADQLLGERRGTTSPKWTCPNRAHAQTGRTPPVSVYRSPRGEQRWRCHGCGAGGTAIDLVMATTGRDVRDALELLAGRATLPSEPWRPTPQPPDPKRLIALGDFVEVCAARLWLPEGRAVRRWLINERGLPRDVLERNRIGADSGSHAARRPTGLPRGGTAVVLPAIHDGTVTYLQLRRLRARPGEHRYLNPAASLATNPRVARVRPVIPLATASVLVTEGPIDALSAATAGYRAVAVLGAATSPELVAARLNAVTGRLVIAFDADEPGTQAATRLHHELQRLGRAAHRLALPDGVNDLNDWHRREGSRWTRALARAVEDIPQRETRSPLSIA